MMHSLKLCRVLTPAALCVLLLAAAFHAASAEAAEKDPLPAAALSANPALRGSDHVQADEGWWSEDVWADPERPFLFYGEGEKTEADDAAPSRAKPTAPAAPAAPAAPPDPQAPPPEQSDAPKPLESLRTMAEVRAEMAARLDRAVMAPSEENIARYLEANAFVLGKAHVFSDRFQRVRIARPEFDWTASHPVANHATAELGERAAADADRFLARIAAEAGLLFIGSGDETLDALASGPAAAFARRYGFETLAVTPAGTPAPGFPDVKPDNGLIGRLGLARRPALLLAAKPDARHPALFGLAAARKPLLFGTGPLAVAELKKRLILRLSPELTGATDETLPSGNGRALETGEAFERRRASVPETLAGRPSRHAAEPQESDSAALRAEPHELNRR